MAINVAKIKDAIQEQNLTWQAADNEFTAMSEKELKYFLGFTPGPKDISIEEREARSVRSLASFNASAAGKGIKKRKAFGAPASFDWRNNAGRNYITAIRNQAACGSCVAFGSLAVAEAVFRIQRGNHTLPIDYSEAQLFYCHAKSEGRNCGNGWWPDKALNALKSKGVVDEACFPYTGGDQACKTCSDAASRTTKISGYTKLTTATTMKNWISTKGPLVGCFSVYQDFYSYRSGVYRRTSNNYIGGHCIAVVGYDDVNKCWICKNSWGATFGESGYFRIGYGQCGIDAEMYGINGIIETQWTGAHKIRGLWSNNAANNSWAYIDSFGWRKISSTSDNIHMNLLIQCISAKNRNQAVNIHLTNGIIDEIYN
ncbi:hypothetical protein GCM10027051_19130 [Niabella terrae]